MITVVVTRCSANWISNKKSDFKKKTKFYFTFMWENGDFPKTIIGCLPLAYPTPWL